MNSEKLFRAAGQISDEKIAEADVFVTKAIKPIWAPIGAACLIVIAAVYALPKLWTTPGPLDNVFYHNSNENTILEDYIKFYFVSADGMIKSESVFIRHTAEDIFAKWAELNNVTGVTLVKAFLESNGKELGSHPDFPDVAGYQVGDYFILTITLSSEFAEFTDGANGQLLVETLKKTFTEYHHFDVNEFRLIISQP
jgi:hypothetical protein